MAATIALQERSTGPVHVLHPGDVACVDRGQCLETLLGSCIAIILTDPRRTVGAMCHIVHAGVAPVPEQDSASYGATALDALAALLRARGINPWLCQAYVYGGGNMFPDLVTRAPIGELNARWTLQALALRQVGVLEQDVGGNRYRRLRWVVGPDAPQVTAVST